MYVTRLQTDRFGDAPSRLANPWFLVRTTITNEIRDPWRSDSRVTICHSRRISVGHFWIVGPPHKRLTHRERPNEPNIET